MEDIILCLILVMGTLILNWDIISGEDLAKDGI